MQVHKIRKQSGFAALPAAYINRALMCYSFAALASSTMTFDPENCVWEEYEGPGTLPVEVKLYK